MVEWTVGAEEQIHQIRLGFTTAAAQKRFDRQLDAALEQLETFPESARSHPSLNRQDVRMLLVGDYRLTVLVLEERLLVFSLVHARSGAAFD